MPKAPEIIKKKIEEVQYDGLPDRNDPDFEMALLTRVSADYAGKGYTAVVKVEDGFVWAVAVPGDGIDPREYVIGLLRQGFLEDALHPLEVLSGMLGDAESLYNYGLCLSELGRPSEAIEPLKRSLAEDEEHNHARVALGVALMQTGAVDEAETVFREACMFDPDDHWANRNLGALYGRVGKFPAAAEHFRRALKTQPDDPGTMLGLAGALEDMGGDSLKEADELYKALIQRMGNHPIAEVAKESRTRIAQKSVRNAVGGGIRMDAVMYMQAAFEKFEELDPQTLGLTILEIVRLGANGLDINNPEKKYRLKSLEGEFSGLQLLSYMHVGIKMVEPDADPQSGLDQEFSLASSMRT